jgi:hypothetical protein
LLGRFFERMVVCQLRSKPRKPPAREDESDE